MPNHLRSNRALLCFVCASPWLSSPSAAETWLVDASSPNGIQDAIDMAQPGDVVLVPPGTYFPFVLDKRLTLVGQGEPGELYVHSGSEITSFDGATLVELTLNDIQVLGTVHPVQFLDCRFHPQPDYRPGTGQPSPEPSAIFASHCQSVFLQRCQVRSTVSHADHPQGAALEAVRSTVVASGCTFRGANSLVFPYAEYYEDGSHGAHLVESIGVFEGCEFVGGSSSMTVYVIGTFTGDSGVGLLAEQQSHVRVRGYEHGIFGNLIGSGSNSVAVHLVEQSSVTYSGMELSVIGDTSGSSETVEVDATSTLVEVELSPFAATEALPGTETEQTFTLRAPASSAGWLVVAGQTSPFALEGYDEPVWCDLGGVLLTVPVVGQGMDSELTFPFSSAGPPSAVGLGLAWKAQVFLPMTPAMDGTEAAVTSPSLIVLQ